MNSTKNQYFFTLACLMIFSCLVGMEKDSECGKRPFGQISSSSPHVAIPGCLTERETRADRDFKYFITNGCFEHVEQMLKEGYTPPVGRFNRILTTLSMSILKNETHLAMAKILIERAGADITFLYGYDGTGKTLLLEAVQRGNCDLVTLLLDAGVTVINKDTRRDFYFPCDRRIFFDRNDAILPLICATKFESCDMMNLLIDCGHADVNATDIYGLNALMYAAMSGHTDQIKILLEHGACIEAKESQLGRTAWLLTAVRCHDYKDTLRYLLSQRADCNAVDVYGENALLVVAGFLWGQNDFIMLLDFPVKADLLYHDRSSLLHQIVKNDWKIALKRMIAIVESPELYICPHPELADLFYHQNNEGKTALMYAAEYDRREMAQMLLDFTHGDRRDTIDNEGNTASMIAKKPEMKKLLDEYQPAYMPLK